MGYTIFLGDVARDEYYRMERLPKLGEKISVEMLPEQWGGMIANAASIFASYGGKARFLSFLNPCDKDLCRQLESVNVDTSLVQYDDTLAQSRCIIHLAENDHTVFIIDMKRHEAELTDETQDALCRADFIYTNYWELQWLRYRGLDAAGTVRQWCEHGAKLVCDLDVDDLDQDLYRRFIPYTYMLFMNKVGYGKICQKIPEKQLMKSGVHILVVTLGENGCRIFEKDKMIEIPALAVDVKDVTGAGDTFCSSFLWGYKETKDAELSGNFATYAAARAITQIGARAGAAGVKGVLSFIKEYGDDASKFSMLLEAGPLRL